MIRYLIKNNFKLMFRNTWSIVVMLLGPILVIAILSSAFSELMKSYEGVDEFAVGYRIQETADDGAFEAAKTAGKKAGILFYEYPEGEIEDIMEKNDLAGFVEFTGDDYVIYKSADYEVEGITLEYFMNKMMNAGIDASLRYRIRRRSFCRRKNWNSCRRSMQEIITALLILFIFAGAG